VVSPALCFIAAAAAWVFEHKKGGEPVGQPPF
jgi:hypothetical protein